MKTSGRVHFFILALIMLFAFSRCNQHSAGVKDVSPADAAKLIQSNSGNSEFSILDVRTPGEYSSWHLEGAVNIDFNANEFETNIGQLDKKKTYLVYCWSGSRSSMAVGMMSKRGFGSLYNLSGGVSGWPH
ncbi:MAG: rhodanese-like domain-containing protein [Bacteroidales bacterium]